MKKADRATKRKTMEFARLGLSAMLLLCMFCGACLAESTAPEAKRQTGLARVAVDDVNFRKEPGKGDLIARLSKDDAVYVFDQRDLDDGYTWYHVRAMCRYKNTDGWIRGDLLVLPDTLFCDLIDVSIAEKHVIALKSDGSVIAGGTSHCDPCNVVGLYNAVNVEAGWYTSFVFFEDQTYWAQGRALGWPPYIPQIPIVTATALDADWAGLYADGSMYFLERYDAEGNLLTIYDAREHSPNIAQIEEGFNLMVCLTKQGKPYVYGYSRDDFLDVEGWEDIIQVSALQHVVGLRADGTVIASGENLYGECNVSDWTDIIDIEAGEGFTIGLRSDGTVVATGNNTYEVCDTEQYRDIVQIEADRFYWVGRTKQGTLTYAGRFAFLDQTDAAGRIYMSSGE